MLPKGTRDTFTVRFDNTPWTENGPESNQEEYHTWQICVKNKDSETGFDEILECDNHETADKICQCLNSNQVRLTRC